MANSARAPNCDHKQITPVACHVGVLREQGQSYRILYEVAGRFYWAATRKHSFRFAGIYVRSSYDVNTILYLSLQR